ncbi:MAG TPA: hypothetical protein ACFYD9_12150 [Candidatus Wunengus sp. YC64]|uniref:hypothetical protein n=1 Tax=Candidatus Wunengus sp. YC64 TaxID=3367700 RepID=UPI002713BE48|nr:hypothetical protein [Candidatus Brocadiales bacterium]
MGDYLRDTRITFLTIGEKELVEIDGELKEILDRANQASPHVDDKASLSYILRYDGMGINRRDFDEIKRSFNRAKEVERVVFQLTSPKNDLNKGKNIQINLDTNNHDNCFLVVADDDEAWVDSNFGRFEKRFKKYKNGNWIAHSSSVELFIQLIGVLFGFSFCLIGANLLAPLLNIKYSFFVLFVGLFLVFSNFWTYILMLIGKARNHLWPLISFKRKPIGLIGQTIIGFIITLLLTELLNISWKILKNIGTLAIK